MKKLSITTYGVLLGLSLSSAAFAQHDQDGQPKTLEDPQEEQEHGRAQSEQVGIQHDFSDSQLQSYVAVQAELEKLRADYSDQLQALEDPQAAAALQQEVQRQTETVVENGGLTMETYQRIANALQNDQELRNRVEQKL